MRSYQLRVLCSSVPRTCVSSVQAFNKRVPSVTPFSGLRTVIRIACLTRHASRHPTRLLEIGITESTPIPEKTILQHTISEKQRNFPTEQTRLVRGYADPQNVRPKIPTASTPPSRTHAHERQTRRRLEPQPTNQDKKPAPKQEIRISSENTQSFPQHKISLKLPSLNLRYPWHEYTNFRSTTEARAYPS